MYSLTSCTHHHIPEVIIQTALLQGEVTIHNPNKTAQAIDLQTNQWKTTNGDHEIGAVTHCKQQIQECA